jgi:hypothetical protein
MQASLCLDSSLSLSQKRELSQNQKKRAASILKSDGFAHELA